MYATSISAVGPTTGAVGDDTRLNPGNVYGATKAFCEHLAAAMCTRPNAPAYLGLRFGYVYGPGRVRGWRDVQMIVERVRAGERHLVYPDYPDPLDWTWIDDAAEVLLRTCERPLPRNAVANVVGDKRHVRDAITHLQRRFPGFDRRRRADPNAAGRVEPRQRRTRGPAGLRSLDDAGAGHRPHARGVSRRDARR